MAHRSSSGSAGAIFLLAPLIAIGWCSQQPSESSRTLASAPLPLVQAASLPATEAVVTETATAAPEPSPQSRPALKGAKPKAASTGSDTLYTARPDTELRSDPDSNARIMVRLAPGEKLRVIGHHKGWALVEHDATSGLSWVDERQVQAKPAIAPRLPIRAELPSAHGEHRRRKGRELIPGEAIEDQLSDHGAYVNRYGETVHRPARSANGSAPDGATAQCGDGTYSFSHHRSGTCSRHDGVTAWLR